MVRFNEKPFANYPYSFERRWDIVRSYWWSEPSVFNAPFRWNIRKENRLYLITFKQGAATGHKAINPGCVTTTNFILIYSKSKEHWHPNRLYTNRGSRDKRYGNFITNINDPFPSWNLITLTEAFAEERKLSIKEARAFIKSYPEQMDNLQTASH